MKDKIEVLKQYFGYDHFRDKQAEIIDSILQKKNIIAILATGMGKSLCFQIPALIFEKVTIVISPLISLMEDQVRELKMHRIQSSFINCTTNLEEYNIILEKLNQNQLKLLYISPERLQNKKFQEALKKVEISLIVIDEAHCMSLWGNDFRPSYLKMIETINSLQGNFSIACFTATATAYVIQDIQRILKLENPKIFFSTFDRPNLFYSVIHRKNKLSFLLNYLKNKTEAGIIYTITRKECEKLSTILREYGFSVCFYHGGLEDKKKSQALRDFMKNHCQIMVATNAFGMGINKSDIRFVINYSIPLNLEDLAQQSGRACRDGAKGEGIVLFDSKDIVTAEYFIRQVKFLPKSKRVIKKLIRHKYQQLYSVLDYCKTKKCLHHFLCHYFGEELPKKCDSCSNCKKKGL